MPTYEYACRGCGEHLEVVQSFRDDPLTTCGSCGGALRKVFSAAGIIFKGSGYYVTDTRAKAESSEGSGGSKGSKGSEGSDKDTGTSSGDAAKKSEKKADKAADKKASEGGASGSSGTAESA